MLKNTPQSPELNKAIKAHQRYLIKSTDEDLNDAIDSYIDAIKKNPELSSAYYRLAALLYNQGQITLDSAIEQCQRAVLLDEKDSDAHMYLGYFMSLAQNFDSAKSEFKKALKLNPKKSRTRLILALTMVEKIKNAAPKPADYLNAFYYGATGGLLSLFDPASLNMVFKNIVKDINYLTVKARGEFLEKIDPKRAYNLYLKAVDDSKKAIPVYEKMARIALNENRYDMAFDCLNNVVILSENDPNKIINAIEFVEKYQNDKTETLIDYYTQLIQSYPKFAKCYYELGHLYLKKEEKLNALSAFKMALENDPNNPYYENSLAFAYVQLEQYDLAANFYKKALEKNPDPEWSSIVAQALAAIYHQVKGNFEAAISTLETALTLTKNKAPIYEALGDVYCDYNDPIMALEYYEMALEINNNNPKLFSRVAMLLWEQDYIEKAIVYYIKALELDPNYDIALNNLGVVYLDGLGDVDRAQECFKKATEINPNYALCVFNLGRALECAGEKVEAAKAYQKALDINELSEEINPEIILNKLHKLFET